MKLRSSFDRPLARLAVAVALVLCGTLAGAPAAATPAAGDQHALGPSIDESLSVAGDDLDDATDGVENETEETAETIDDTAENATEGVEDAAGDTAEAVDDDGDEATATANETGDSIANGTAPIDGSAELVDATVTGTSPIVLNAAAGADGSLTGPGILADGRATEEPDDSPGSSADEGSESDREARAEDDDREGAANDETRGPVRRDAASTAADALLVGALGAMTASGVAGGAGAGAGAGAGGASGLSATANSLRHIRRAGSAIPWEMIPVFKYSRYDDSDPLENDRRRAIYETIEAQPGCYLTELSDRSDVSLSTVRHHVRVLGDEGMVTTAKVNGKRRYYLDAAGTPNGADRPKGEAVDPELHAALAEPAKRDVLEALAELGRAHNGRLADALDRDPSTISHHLSSLAEDDLVVRERDGRATVNELAPKVEEALADSIDREVASPTPADD